MRRTLIAATIPLAVAPIVLLRDMGPLPGTSLRHTVWRKGMRLLVYGANTPLRPADFAIPGAMITVVPDGYQDDLDALAKATTIIIKFAPGQLVHEQAWPGRHDHELDGGQHRRATPRSARTSAARSLCTSRRRTTSCARAISRTFDATRGAQVIFGPAARPLPQLPIGVDAQGFLVAES